MIGEQAGQDVLCIKYTTEVRGAKYRPGWAGKTTQPAAWKFRVVKPVATRNIQ